MKNHRLIRRTTATLALGAIAGGLTLGAVPAASAGTVAPLVTLIPGSIVTAGVTVLDFNNMNNPKRIPDPTQTSGSFQNYIESPDLFVNPQRIRANDQINVCSTFTNPGNLATPATPFTVTGPSYYIALTVPSLAGGDAKTVCTGFYNLNFPSSVACITLKVKPTGYAAAISRTFAQNTNACPYSIIRAYDLFDSSTAVTVMDLNNISNPTTVGTSANADRFVNPAQVHANDRVNVCTTITNPGNGATSTTRVDVTGPSYNWTGTAPVLTGNKPQTVCTGYYRLNWSGAFPAANSYPVPCSISLKTTVGTSPTLFGGPLVVGTTRPFTQAGLMCAGAPVVIN